jgi:putative membrane protein
MMVSYQPSIAGLLVWQWRSAALFTAAALLAQVAHVHIGWTHLTLPAFPVSIVGAAIGIFASFRTNSCYARWWEGRQLWGRLVNASRTLGSQAVCWLPEDDARAVTRDVTAYVHALRCALREDDPWTDPPLLAATSEAARERLRAERNVPYAVLHGVRERVTRVSDEGRLHDLRLASLDRSITELIDAQGGCERIKKTPFPKGYAFIADRLIIAFGCLLPFALVREIGWFALPINLLVCGAFTLISEAGRVLEDPFSHFFNGLPLSAITATIEINLRQRHGETDVPALPKPDARGILM